MTGIFLNIVEIILAVTLIIPLFYLLFFTLSGFKQTTHSQPVKPTYHSFLVIIPAYKEDNVISSSIEALYSQDYPGEKFDICTIAREMDVSSIPSNDSIPVHVFEPENGAGGKAAALNLALEKMPQTYDIVLIVDADNILHNDFLKIINNYYSRGYQCIQGHRTAKNYNNSLAILDAASENINNHIFRRGHWNVGLSASLIGSAMAFDYKLFLRIMPSIKTMMGFDKELEHELLRNHHKIAWAEHAFALDEKIHRKKDFVAQRRRWVSAQLYYLKCYIREGWHALIHKKNMDFFNKTFHMLMLPRSIILGLLVVVTIVHLIIPVEITKHLIFSAYFWASSLLIFALTLFLAIPAKTLNIKLIKALIYVPVGIFLMTKSTVTTSKKNIDYRTPHSDFKS